MLRTLRQLLKNRARRHGYMDEREHVEGEFLVNKDMSRVADQQVHRVIHRSSARILNRHNPEIFRRSQYPIEDRFNRRTSRKHGASAEPLASKDVGERSFGAQVTHGSHKNLVKRQSARCK